MLTVAWRLRRCWPAEEMPTPPRPQSSQARPFRLNAHSVAACIDSRESGWLRSHRVPVTVPWVMAARLVQVARIAVAAAVELKTYLRPCLRTSHRRQRSKLRVTTKLTAVARAGNSATAASVVVVRQVRWRWTSSGGR